MSTALVLEGALLHEDSGSIRHQSKVRITGLTIKRGFVFENEYMLPGKSSMLSESQCLGPCSIEFPNARRVPRFVVPDVIARRRLKGVDIIGLARRPSILLVVVITNGIVEEELSGPGVDSPPSSIGDREPSSDDDHVEFSGVVDVAIPIDDLEHLGSRITLKSTFDPPPSSKTAICYYTPLSVSSEPATTNTPQHPESVLQMLQREHSSFGSNLVYLFLDMWHSESKIGA